MPKILEQRDLGNGCGRRSRAIILFPQSLLYNGQRGASIWEMRDALDFTSEEVSLLKATLLRAEL